MNNKKMIRVISLVVVLSLTFTFSVFAFPQHKVMQFEKKNFDKAAEYMKENGFVKGDGSGNYYWKDYVKRGDISVMIVRAFKLSIMLGDNFGDVDPKDYYYDAILTVKNHGIAKGDGKHFNPKKYVTIEEAIALIERSASVANSNVVINKKVDLHKMYMGDLTEYATREDIANMLYYVLTGDEYDDDKDDEDYKYDIDALTYTIKENTVFGFDADDVDDLIREIEKVSDEDFEYLNFTNLPLKTEGKLYYDYTSATDFGSYVKSSIDYYESKDPKISDVTFVPKTDFSGTVSLEYEAYDDEENSYTGIIKIVVEEKDVDLGTIKYDVKENGKLTLDDKIVNAFEKATDDKEFNYVMFKTPSIGKLYYDYTSASDYDYVVKDTNKYYDETDIKISKLTYVPKTNYTGTASIEFTVYDKDKNSYTGIIEIDVEEDIVTLDTIKYDTDENTSIKFDVNDFIDELDDKTNSDLNYVKFSLPIKTEGKLYYDYSSASNYKSVVTDSAKYFVKSSKYLDKVTFVPYTNFDGVVEQILMVL